MVTTPCVDHGKSGSRGGYASCWFEGKFIGQHVRALILATAEKSGGRHALHACDNKRCINPEHLSWGTRSENMAQCVERGRHVNNLSNFQHTNRKRGEENPAARWTQEQIQEMRAAYGGGEKQTSIAARYGCRQSDVSRIVRRAAWGHV